ncbi:MAG TPA: site-2 protease family protein [Acidimicrobiales bacterium]|nr:site-2 protease family protein [Acidimicrobiales bacterium]
MTLIAKDPGAATPPEADSLSAAGPEHSGNAGRVVRLVLGLAAITAAFLAAGLSDLLLFIVILVVIVMLHELGHFATAKWASMKVTEYFVGFGPRLWSVRRGETEYGVKAIPAGGYVRITGFTVLEEVAAEDEARTYRQQPFWKRIIVASAGSAMHFLIALVLAIIVVFAFGVPSGNVTVTAMEKWAGVAQTPAARAGLQAGDTIVSVNGKALDGAGSMASIIGRSTGKAVTVGIVRNGHLRQISVTPANGRGIKVNGQTLKNRGYLGVEIQPATDSPSPLHGLGYAFTTIGQVTNEEMTGVAQIFSPSGLTSVLHQVTNAKAAKAAADHPGSAPRPVSLVGIASLGVQAQQGGLEDLLLLLISLNIVFGLINMLPMLPLDGGHVAVAVYEWIRTKKGQAYYRADITKLYPVVFVFLAFLATFVLSGVFLDLTHPINNPFQP